MGFWSLWHCHGGICPVLKSGEMTQAVGVGQDGKLWTKPATGNNVAAGTFSTSSPDTPAASWKCGIGYEVVNTSGLVLDAVNHKLIVPDGVNYVLVSGQLSILSGASGNYSVYVKVNGTTKATGTYKVDDVYTQTINTNMVVVPVSAGDEITLEAACTAGSPAGYASGSLTVIVIG